MTVYDIPFSSNTIALYDSPRLFPRVSSRVTSFRRDPSVPRNLFDRVTGFSISLDRLSYRLYSTKSGRRSCGQNLSIFLFLFFLKYLFSTGNESLFNHETLRKGAVLNIYDKNWTNGIISISIISTEGRFVVYVKIVICRRGEIFFFSTHVRPPISSFSPCVGIPYNYRAENVLSRGTRFPSRRFYYFPFLLLLLFLSLSRRLCPAFSLTIALTPQERGPQGRECPDREIAGIRGGDLLLSR